MFTTYDIIIKNNVCPPTDKQVRYAKAISEFFEIDLPEEYSSRAYSKFISENKEEYEDAISYVEVQQWYNLFVND